jgi:hypothetical protein
MKCIHIFTMALVFILLPVMAIAHSLAWSKNNVEPDLAGYNAYDITTGRVKLNATTIPTSVCTGTPLTCTFSIPTASHIDGHKFVVTAIDAGGNESLDSNTATLDLSAPVAPGSLLIINQ